ncbi:CASP8 and FADD-like apoptosis regulator [Anneissia japonica]|uniref:CASP8 and FADD-like apoptosis regulator n=1 Tax=Anneissia japonica TaxID=1529436 RepID=UPI00142567A7|nr:CASP8 and FADD-like apoptosis regulator [Anneissia japonica]
MLKVLFRDKIKYNDLAKATKTIELLNSLTVRDVLTTTDLTILSDTISVTEQFNLQWEIKKQLKTFPDVDEITISKHFKPYRLRLMKFGILLDEKYVVKIDDLYNSPTSKEYADVWVMITDLEDRMKIWPKEEIMNEFISTLESLELDIQPALNALKEDIQDPHRTTGEPVQESDIQASSLYRSMPTEEPAQKLESKPNSNTFNYFNVSLTASLKNVFEECFGFYVDVRRNQKAKGIKDAIYDYSKTVDYTEYDCFICCILSHGKEGSVAGYDGELVDITQITFPFRSTECHGLKNKPKLFFIQSCMGCLTPKYVAASADATTPEYEEASINETRRRLCPDDRDFLFGYSTVEGNKSFVDNKSGSPYIQALTETLKNEPLKNMYIILTCVNDEVSSKEMCVWNKREKKFETVMQVPFLKSTLSGQVIFSPK